MDNILNPYFNDEAWRIENGISPQDIICALIINEAIIMIIKWFRK